MKYIIISFNENSDNVIKTHSYFALNHDNHHILLAEIKNFSEEGTSNDK